MHESLRQPRQGPRWPQLRTEPRQGLCGQAAGVCTPGWRVGWRSGTGQWPRAAGAPEGVLVTCRLPQSPLGRRDIGVHGSRDSPVFPRGRGRVRAPAGDPGALRGWQPAQQGAVSQVRNEEGKVVRFHCGLCECGVGNATARDTHLRGRRHRLQYKVCGAGEGSDRQGPCTLSHAPSRSSGPWGSVPHIPWRPRQTRPWLGSPWPLSAPNPPVAGRVPKHTEQAHRCSREGAWGRQGSLGARGRDPEAPAATG